MNKLDSKDIMVMMNLLHKTLADTKVTKKSKKKTKKTKKSKKAKKPKKKKATKKYGIKRGACTPSAYIPMPKTALTLYATSRKDVINEGLDTPLTIGQVRKRVGDEWEKLSDEAKAPFEGDAKVGEGQYKIQIGRRRRIVMARTALHYFALSRKASVNADTEGDKLPIGQVKKRVSDDWDKLPVDERTMFEMMAANDTERYQLEIRSSLGRGVTNKSIINGKLNAWILYCMSRRDTALSNNPNMTFGDLSGLYSHEWKSMTDEQKAPFIEKMKADKLRYDTEFDNLEPHKKSIMKRNRRQTLVARRMRPRRAITPYMRYVKTEHKHMSKERPELQFTAVGQALGAKWATLTDDQRKPWIVSYAEDIEECRKKKDEFEAVEKHHKDDRRKKRKVESERRAARAAAL